MSFLQHYGKKNSTGNRFIRMIATLFAVVFAFTSIPSADAFADTTSKVMNPGYIFRDERPDSNGIPAYYHKGVKYNQLNDNEKKIFDQVVLLHLYLIDPNRDDTGKPIAQYASCFSEENTQGDPPIKLFNIDFSSSEGGFNPAPIEVSEPKNVNASGAAIDYYNAYEIGNDKELLQRLVFKQINIQKAMEALFVDLPDLFWWDKTLWGWNCGLEIVSGTNKVKVSDIKITLVVQKDKNGNYYTKNSIPEVMREINDFAERTIFEVESKGFWETVKGGEGASVTEVPGVLSDYDKLLGTAIFLEKLIKFDEDCHEHGDNVAYAKSTSVGIDCVTRIQNHNWTNMYELSDEIEAVCEGYSEIFKYICDKTSFYNPVKIGIEIGYAGSASDPESGYGRHEWNVATIGRYDYVIDLTNDDLHHGLLLRGKEDKLGTQPQLGKGYYLTLGSTGKSIYYLFGGDGTGRDEVTEAVRYEPYNQDFIKSFRGKYVPKLLVKGNDGIWRDDISLDNSNGIPQITYKAGDHVNRALEILSEDTPYSEPRNEYELIKSDEFPDGVLPPYNGTVVQNRECGIDNNNPRDLNFGDPHDLAPGNYTIYAIVTTWEGYSYPLKGQSFTVLPATLTPSVAVKNGSGKVSIASSEINNDLKDRFEIKLEGVASGDEVSAQITSLQLTNVVDSTTTTEGSAGISATFTLTGKDAQNYVLANNGTTIVTLANAITISKKQPATNPDQGGTTEGGGTSGGGTVGGGTVGGGTTGGETVGGGSEGGGTVGGGTVGGGTVGGGTVGGGTSGSGTVGGGTVGGGTVGGGTVGGGTSGGGTVGGGSVGGGTSGGGGVSGGGAVSGGGGAVSGGGGAISGGGATAGGTDATKKDDETAEKKDDKASDDKKDDKASDDKKDDKASDDKKDDKKEDDGTVVVENEDGSVTTTNISVNKKGSVIVESVTENTDGSTVETRVKTTKSGNVTETTTEKDADGNVLSTVESTYSVSSKGTVKMTAIETDEKEVEIPKTVEVAGEERTVTQIAKYALKNNKTMTSARIGENITSIGAGAFKNNKKLKTIELTDSVKKVYKNAFKGIAKNAVFKIKASSKKKFDKIVALLKASGVSDTVTFEMVE